jgi:hypothetical protein
MAIYGITDRPGKVSLSLSYEYRSISFESSPEILPLGSRALPTALATRPVNATASATALEAEKL